jgi:hypothetical protein
MKRILNLLSPAWWMRCRHHWSRSWVNNKKTKRQCNICGEIQSLTLTPDGDGNKVNWINET